MKTIKTDAFVQELIDHYGDWVQDNKENRAGGTALMTDELYPYTSLFSPIRVNGITIKNRIVMAPMGNISMCEETGRPNSKMIKYFTARAKGGVGLITTGLVPVSHGIDHAITEQPNYSYFPRIDKSRTNLAGWRDLAQSVHNYGSRIFIQLSAGLGRVGNPECLVTKYKFPVSASNNGNFYITEIPSLRLSDRKLRKIIKNAGQASADAKACGIDGIYLHGHEGYLLEQMTNQAFNRRKVGRYKDWQRFGIEMIEEIRHRVGPKMPIMYRIDLSLALNETYGEEGMKVKPLRKFKNGRSVAETLDYMAALVKAGVDMFDVDLGCYDNWWLPHPPAGMPAGCFLPVSKITKEFFKRNNILSNAGLEVPIVAVGKLGYPDISERALREEQCDMVMLGRPLLCDPDWPNKAYAGEVSKITPCIGCQEGCINEFVEGGHPQCAVNARTGFEDIFPEYPPPASVRKKIIVIGAGPAGINFGIVAARRGHQVEMYESQDKIGGKIVPGSVPKIKFDVYNYLKFLRDEIAIEEERGNLKLHLNTPCTPEIVEKSGCDAIVVASGTKDFNIPFKGIETVKTVEATELIMNPELAKDAKKLCVIGGGAVGLETAYMMRYEYDKDVDIVEMAPTMMTKACTANRGHLLHYLKRADVKIYNCAKLMGFEDGRAVVEQIVDKSVPDPYNTWQPVLPENVENPFAKKIKGKKETIHLDCDLVVLALGGYSDTTLFAKLQELHLSKEIYNIADSFSPGRVLEANRAAYNLGIRI